MRTLPSEESGDPSKVSRPAVNAPGRIRRLALKELRETLRDRRTIVTLVLMPVLLYPLLSVVFQRFLLSQSKPEGETAYQLGVVSEEEWDRLRPLLESGERILRETEPEHAERKSGEKPPVSPVLEPSLEEAVARGRVDIGVRVRAAEPLRFPRGTRLPAADVEILQLRGSPSARNAAEYVERRLAAVERKTAEAWLHQFGVSGRTSPIDVVRKPVEPADGTTAFSLASLVPLILVLMTITGAVYPAIDLTAGERERGTLEALIAAPVPRMGLLLAKYVAVLTVAMLTATINLLAMTVTILAVGLGPVLFGRGGLSFVLVLQVFGLLMLFAAFFSAVLLAITSFARSFKEAQAYLIPVMLVSMAPGMATLLPGVKLDAPLAVTPLLNIVLLARDLCEQQTADPVLILVVVLSTALFACGALAIAARIFGADAILYGSQGTWSDLWRRPEEGASAPTLASALLVLALLFPSYFLLSHVLARTGEFAIGARLALSGGLTVLLFVGFPLSACGLRGVRVINGLRLRRPPLLAVFGALLLGCSLWTGAFEAVALADRLGMSPLDATMKERVKELLAAWKTVSPVWVLLALSVAPGVCEELFFRGFLLSALRTRMADWPAIVASAVLFGAFHLITTDSLTVVRFIPSTLLGVALGWICVRTGSVIPGMLMHALHNGLLLSVALYEDDLTARGWGIEEATHLPAGLLVTAAMVALVGFATIWVATRTREDSVVGV